MVNYLYKLNEIEDNHERYKGAGKIKASPVVPRPGQKALNLIRQPYAHSSPIRLNFATEALGLVLLTFPPSYRPTPGALHIGENHPG